MYFSWFSWSSPVGLAIFLAGTGIFFWGLFSGIARMNKSKRLPTERDGAG